MRWYLNTWRTSQPKNWTTFITQNEVAFQEKFPGNKLAPADSRLAQNLEYLLNTLSKSGEDVQDEQYIAMLCPLLVRLVLLILDVFSAFAQRVQ